MGIDGVSAYIPKHTLPIYTKITDPKFNDYSIGEKYKMRVEDQKRQDEKGETGSFNYTHEAILISKEEMKFEDVPGILIAFDGHSRDAEEAIDTICPGEGSWDGDKDVVMLIFLRVDKAKEWIMSDAEVIEPPTSVKDHEDDG